MFESMAEYWPPAWRELAAMRIRWGFPHDEIDYALRRGVEEMPFDPEAWNDRARYAAAVGDEKTEITCLVGAAEADPANITLLLDVAVRLVKYVMAHKAELPERRRGALLASVRAQLEEHAGQLPADGLSRLSWLFLLEGDRENARRYADAGLKLDPQNQYCQNLVDRIGR
jgi:hypothetical protein